MNVEQAYNQWALQYDTNLNKTRDLEAMAIREMLAGMPYAKVLEIGCGTGKNTAFLLEKATFILALDLSLEMLAQARQKVNAENVVFKQADITGPWHFSGNDFDLATFSLVLEHIEDIDHVFRELSLKIKAGGFVYVGELHPFKQYNGSKARFETEEGLKVVTCFTHHISDFTHAATNNGFEIARINEYFDSTEEPKFPRILSMIFRKSSL